MSLRGLDRSSARGSRPMHRPEAPRRQAATAAAVGTYFRTMRRLQGLTLARVADMTSASPGRVSKAMLSAIESGRHLPGLQTFVSLSRVMHIDPAEVYDLVHAAVDVPVDLTEVSTDDLRHQAKACFWAGDFRRALGIYDALLERLALVPPEDEQARRHEQARIEILRASALRRIGALSAARGAALRATTLARGADAVQAEAYVVLAATLAQTGDLPVARDLVDRAARLAEHADRAVLAVVWHEKGALSYRLGEYGEAHSAFVQAKKLLPGTRNANHQPHVEGNIGSCLLSLGKVSQARRQFVRAIELARKYNAVQQEASWTIQLGRVSFEQGRFEEAEQHGRAALPLARRSDDPLAVFRAEWLLHRVARLDARRPADTARVTRLCRLYQRVRDHHGIDEIEEFRASGYLPAPKGGDRP